MHGDRRTRTRRLLRRLRNTGARASRWSILLISIGLVACAGPEPILKSTTYLQLHGKEQAEREAAVCGLKAERAGLQHGTNRSGNAGAGIALGVVGGAAVGWVLTGYYSAAVHPQTTGP